MKTMFIKIGTYLDDWGEKFVLFDVEIYLLLEIEIRHVGAIWTWVVGVVDYPDGIACRVTIIADNLWEICQSGIITYRFHSPDITDLPTRIILRIYSHNLRLSFQVTFK